MEKENVSGKIVDVSVLKRLLRFTQPYKGRFAILILLTVTLGALAPLTPVLIQYTLNNHVAAGDYQGLLMIVSLLVGLLVVQASVQYSHTYLSGWLGQHVIRDIRIKLYDHLLRLKLKFYDNTPIGRLVTRTISDIETLADVFSQGLAAMISDVLQLIFIVGAMFFLNWKLALISLATFPLMVISTYVFKEKIKVAFNEVRNAVSNLNTFVQEHITGMNIVQIFASEETEFKKFEKINEEHKKAHIRSIMYYSVYFPVAEILSATAIGLLIWFGAKEVINTVDPTLQAGTLVSFIMFIQMFFRPLRQIADRFNTLQMGIVSTKRIVDLLDNDEHIANQGTQAPEAIKGSVKFDKVWFAYNERDYVLKDISFEVKPGETAAFVGATGAGKSSIINLLSRFYEINRGEIFLDGQDTTKFELSALRKNIGVVLQDVFLFSDTIRNNITLGNPEIKDEQIWEAIRLVGADKFIDKLKDGLDHDVKERGSTLSVGQRQLISFVRAMVYNPKILVLDEATSSVDTETEELIQSAISKMMLGRTSIVIAHRLSTIQKADSIIVMEKGEIVEKGKHSELIERDGPYSQLYKMQYKEVS